MLIGLQSLHTQITASASRLVPDPSAVEQANFKGVATRTRLVLNEQLDRCAISKGRIKSTDSQTGNRWQHKRGGVGESGARRRSVDGDRRPTGVHVTTALRYYTVRGTGEIRAGKFARHW